MTFRISVESVIRRMHEGQQEILIVKRAPDCKVAPGVWNVPAGKVNQLETTTQAVIRETEEETKLKVEVIELLAEHAFEIKVVNEKAYRNVFTYLTKPLQNFDKLELNDEHTEFKWITKKDLNSDEYSSIMPRLKDLLQKVFDDDNYNK